MLSVENLTFRYRKKSSPVLNGVNLELKQGEIVAWPSSFGGYQKINTATFFS